MQNYLYNPCTAYCALSASDNSRVGVTTLLYVTYWFCINNQYNHYKNNFAHLLINVLFPRRTRMNTDSAITTVLALAFTTTYCANLLILWQFVWWSREKDVILQRRLQNYKQKREKHFVVSSAQMSTQKIVLWIFLVSMLPEKSRSPIFSPLDILTTK